MRDLTTKEKATIERNYTAYCTHFETPVILKGVHTSGFYVYRNASDYENSSDSYVQYCYDLSYLDGWLYGTVQGYLGQLTARGGV